jgi:hypothetical protein
VPSKVAHLADSKVVVKDTQWAELLVGMMVAKLDGMLAEMRVVAMDKKKVVMMDYLKDLH